MLLEMQRQATHTADWLLFGCGVKGSQQCSRLIVFKGDMWKTCSQPITAADWLFSWTWHQDAALKANATGWLFWVCMCVLGCHKALYLCWPVFLFVVVVVVFWWCCCHCCCSHRFLDRWNLNTVVRTDFCTFTCVHRFFQVECISGIACRACICTWFAFKMHLYMCTCSQNSIMALKEVISSLNKKFNWLLSIYAPSPITIHYSAIESFPRPLPSTIHDMLHTNQKYNMISTQNLPDIYKLMNALPPITYNQLTHPYKLKHTLTVLPSLWMNSQETTHSNNLSTTPYYLAY